MGERDVPAPVLSLVPLPALHLREGVVVAANEGGLLALGGGADDPLGALQTDDRAALLARAARAADASAGAPSVVELRTQGPPPLRFFEAAVGPHPDGGAVVVVVETTEARRTDAALSELATGVYTTDSELRGRWLPRAVGEGLGLAPEGFEGIDVLGLVHPDDHAVAHDLAARAIATPGMKFAGTMRIMHPNQPGAFWPVVAYLTWLPHHDALGGLLVRFDAGLAADHHRDDSEASEGMITLGDASPIGFLNLTVAGTLVQRSTRVREILRPVGVADDVSDWLDRVRPGDRLLVDELLAAGRRGEPRLATEVGFEGEGTTVWVRLDVLPYRNTEGAVVGTFVNFLDVTAEHEAVAELAAAREELWHLANRDALTGLLNRMPFAERLGRAVEGVAGRHGFDHDALPGVLVCDLDGFKEVNDRHGHRVGDAVLVEAGRRLVAAVREGDTVCRFGGDEFLVLCERATAADLERIASRIVAALGAPIDADGTRVTIGVSVGGALARPGDEDDPDGLVLRADRAMYEAKGAGRGRAVVAPLRD